MIRHRTPRRLMLATLLVLPLGAAAQAPGAAEAMAAQRQALAPLAIFDGLWRGPAKVMAPGGRMLELTQTERVGPLLGGTVRLVEGRGHAGDGTLQFNAFAVMSWQPRTQTYNFHSYAQGHESDFPLEVRADGFTWSIPAGPATIRYTATVKDGVWSEIGERVLPGQPPVRIFEMTLTRVGPTDWPAAGALGPQ